MKNEQFLIALVGTLVISFLLGVFMGRRQIIENVIAKFRKIKKVPAAKEYLNKIDKIGIKTVNLEQTLSIGITTFPARFDVLSKQVANIRELDSKIEILLAVNSFYEKPFIRDYTNNILTLCKDYNLFPIFFPKFSGLAKMWNTLIRHMATSHILLLNDDLEIDKRFSLQNIRNHIQVKEFFTINNSFSHFVISLRDAIALNFFSERFIAFGEEDGDFVWRYIEKYNTSPEILVLEGITNKVLNNISFDHGINIEKDPYGGNKPIINSEITKSIYEFDPKGIKGMFNKTYKRKIVEPIQYPLEDFIINNWDNIRHYNNIIW